MSNLIAFNWAMSIAINRHETHTVKKVQEKKNYYSICWRAYEIEFV